MSRICDRTDEEVVALMHRQNAGSLHSTFQRLVQLLGGDELKAAHALREENLYVVTHVHNYGKEFGEFTRTWLVINGLPWSQDNLAAAARAYEDVHGK